MTENQKRIAIIVIVFIIILILMMRGGNTVVNRGGNVPGIDVPASGGINLGERRPFILPDFGLRDPSRNLSAIGACCADCSGRSQLRAYVPATRGVTIVNNEGARGPNIFNFFSPTPSAAPQVPLYIPRGNVNVRMRLNV